MTNEEALDVLVNELMKDKADVNAYALCFAQVKYVCKLADRLMKVMEELKK